MARRKSTRKVAFNTKLIMDVIGASLIVQKAPALLNAIVPIDPSLRAVAGVGIGYFAGKMFNRSDLANASIALGAVDFVSPFIDDLLGTFEMQQLTPGTSPSGGANVQVAPGKSLPPAKVPPGVNDFVDISLNDYVRSPGRASSYYKYAGSYN